MKDISVIMPVYNTKEEYFRKAIESILNQTFKNFELIIVDNGSEDYITNIIKDYKDKRIKSYRINTNKGPAYARNYGISKSTGKYIAFMDSDDISLPERLSIQYNFLEKNSDIGCLGIRWYTKGKKGIVARSIFKHDKIVEFLLFNGCVLLQSTIMLRRDVLISNNIKYNIKYVPAEDYALYLDLIDKTKFEVIKDRLVIYRYHKKNISHIKNELQREKGLTAQINAIERICNTKIPMSKDIIALCKKRRFELNDIRKFEKIILNKNILSNEILTKFFKSKSKKIYYHSHGLKKQLYLLHSPLAKYFEFPILWRMFVFITRIF